MNTPMTRTLNTTGEHTDSTRELSPAERWYWIIDQLSTLNVCARVRIEGEPSTERLRAALDGLQRRHSLLRLAIAEDSSGAGPRFVPTDNPIPLREVRLSQPEDDRWVHEVDDHEFAESIDWRSGPLARATIIRHSKQIHDLVITLPHCISDGTTALALLRQCVRLTVEYPNIDQNVAPGPITPPVEALMPARFLEMSDELPDRDPAARDEPDAVEQKAGRLEPDRFVPFDKRRTRLLHRVIGSDALESLLLACKREGVTIHGVLAAAMACAVASDADAPPPTHFAVGSPVTFRNELDQPVSEDEVGCYVSAIHSTVLYQPDDLWAMARFINRDITERRQRGEEFPVFSLLAHQGPAGVADSEPFVRFIEEHGSFNFFISNIGRFDFPSTLGEWRFSEAQFVGGISVVGYFAASVTTSHGQLSWNFTHIDGAVSQERAERLVDDSVATVLAATASS